MRYLSILPLILILFLSACKEDQSSEVNYNPNVLSSKDYIRGEDNIYEVVNAFFKGVNDSLVNENGYSYIDNCDVTYLPSIRTLVFGYGNEDRMCQDGKYRRGNFVAIFSGAMFDQGVIAHIRTDSLYVDNYPVQIVMDIENLGLNAENKLAYSLAVDSSLIMLPDTTKTQGIQIQTDLVMVWQEGSNTVPIHEDDLFLVTGTAWGISTDNYQFELTITDPLYDWLDCYWVYQGINEITVPVAEFKTGDIDYGVDDGCNNLFYFFFNSSTFYDEIK